MRVLISGGGIAGLTLAYWLHHYRIAVVVIEQQEQMHQGGYGLDFYGTGYDVAEHMGILDTLRQQQVPVEAVTYITTHGKLIASLDTRLMFKMMHGRYMALMHSTLEDTLYQTIAARLEIRYGTSITAVEAGKDEVAVTFNDGTMGTFDVLIGADGVHSQTRRLVFGQDRLYSHSLGYNFACSLLPDRYGIGHVRKNYVEPGRLTVAYNTNNEGEIGAMFIYKTSDGGPIPRQQRLPLLREVFAGMGWITQSLLDDIADPQEIFMDTMIQIQMPAWSQGRVALIGDACGSPTPMSGQGASMAVGGAYTLARALHEERDYTAAFLRYEDLLRPFVQKRQKNARMNIRAFLQDSKPALVAQQLLMRLLIREAFSGLLIRQFGAESLLSARPEWHHEGAVHHRMW